MSLLDEKFESSNPKVLNFTAVGVPDPLTFSFEVVNEPVKTAGESHILWARFNGFHFLLKKLTDSTPPFLGSTATRANRVTENLFGNTFVNEQKEQRLDRFIKITQLINSLNSPNLMYIPAVIESNGDNYAMMQAHFNSGEIFSKDKALTLDNLIKSNRDFTIDLKVRIVKQLVGLVKWLHEKGIYHFDLKPNNILILKDGTVILIDFGLSIDRRNEIGELDRVPDIDLKGLAGTPNYITPDRILYANGDIPEIDFFASELYSLGLLFFELFTGHHVFEQVDLMLLQDRILESNFDNRSDYLTIKVDSDIDDIAGISDDQKMSLKFALKLLLKKDPNIRKQYLNTFVNLVDTAFTVS